MSRRRSRAGRRTPSGAPGPSRVFEERRSLTIAVPSWVPSVVQRASDASRANDGLHGTGALSDGTAEGTVFVKALGPGRMGTPVVSGDRFFFHLGGSDELNFFQNLWTSALPDLAAVHAVVTREEEDPVGGDEVVRI